MRIVVVFVVVLTLSGCASREEIAAGDDDKCLSYGLKFGTPEYAQCRQNLDGQRQTNRRAALSRIDNALTSFHPESPNYVVGPNPPIVMQTPPAPRNCTSIVNGQMINTTCY